MQTKNRKTGKLKLFIQDYGVQVAMVLVAVALVIAVVAVTAVRGSAAERAAAELEDRGYTVVSTERHWVSVTCLHKDDAHVVVRVIDDGEEKDIDTCVNLFRVKVKD